MRYDVSVYTAFRRADGSLFADLGTFRWPGVSEAMRDWLATSCRVTAFRLVNLDAHPGGYALEYRTIVTEAGSGAAVSDTGLIKFEDMSYAQVLEFERWALSELATMLELFAAEHAGADAAPERRSKIATLWRWFVAWSRR